MNRVSLSIVIGRLDVLASRIMLDWFEIFVPRISDLGASASPAPNGWSNLRGDEASDLK